MEVVVFPFSFEHFSFAENIIPTYLPACLPACLPAYDMFKKPSYQCCKQESSKK